MIKDLINMKIPDDESGEAEVETITIYMKRRIIE